MTLAWGGEKGERPASPRSEEEAEPKKRRRRIEHTEDQGQLELRLDWTEQIEYEKIRAAVVFGDPVILCAEKTGTLERTLSRRVESFDAYGMEGLIPLEPLRGREDLARCLGSRAVAG